MEAKLFDYYLPPGKIAQHPLKERDASRLMVIDRKTGSTEDAFFVNLFEYLCPGDILVINETKVIPARLYGKGSDSSRTFELLFLKEIKAGYWEVMVKPARKALKGNKLYIEESVEAEITGYATKGRRLLKIDSNENLNYLLLKYGKLPLPPYIKHYQSPDEGDSRRYQTIYARIDGSIAAPTAGLHFTEDLLKKIRNKGIEVVSLVLHIGAGTFTPVRAEIVENHHMEEEYFEITESTARIINEGKKQKRRIIAVGTTCIRALESSLNGNGFLYAKKGFTNLFIYPGFKFMVADALITNFHLPRSTLLMLVSAFAGREIILKAYNHAIDMDYRFYSYGDAMLIL